jgi:hypothetical protein
VRQYLLRAAAQTAVKAGTKMAASAQQKIAKASVRVNRNVPAVTSPSFAMTFGVDVSTETLRRMPVFAEPMPATSAPSAEERNTSAGCA